MTQTIAAYKGRDFPNEVVTPNNGISEFWPFLNNTEGTPFLPYTNAGGSVFGDTRSNGLTVGTGGVAFSVSDVSGPDTASIYLGNMINPPEVISTFETAILFDVVPTGSRQSRVKLGFSGSFSSAGLAADWGGLGAAFGAFFCFDSTVSNYWICKLQNATQTINMSTTSTVVPVADTTVYFKIIWTPSAAFYYINTALVATHQYTFASLDFQSCSMGVGIKKTANSVYTSMVCQGIKFTQQYNTKLFFT